MSLKRIYIDMSKMKMRRGRDAPKEEPEAPHLTEQPTEPNEIDVHLAWFISGGLVDVELPSAPAERSRAAARETPRAIPHQDMYLAARGDSVRALKREAARAGRRGADGAEMIRHLIAEAQHSTRPFL